MTNFEESTDYSASNAFSVLGASVRDNRQTIVELAEEASLTKDQDLCLQARSELTNPRRRINAEVSWFPGVAPNKTKSILEALHEKSTWLETLDGLPPLARSNLLAIGIQLLSEEVAPDTLRKWILKLANASAEIEPYCVLLDINEDREIAGIPAIKSVEDLEQSIQERLENFRSIVLKSINSLTAEKLLAVMTSVMESATRHGTQQAPALVDELADSYRSRVEGLLERESEKISSLVENIKSLAPRGEQAIRGKLNQLNVAIRKWDSVAQPVQLSFKSRGIDHGLSQQIAYEVRSMCVDLVNQHGMVDVIKPTVSMLKEMFAELPDVVETLEQDQTALDNLERQKQQQARNEAQFNRSITFSIELGAIFKNEFSIEPRGVYWKNQHFRLEDIDGVRWGAVRQSINGIPSGTTYTIAIRSGTQQIVLHPRREAAFSKILDPLWRAICVRLIIETLQNLGSGQAVDFAGLPIQDQGVRLTKSKFFKTERVLVPWDQTACNSWDGNFMIWSLNDRKLDHTWSYIQDWNTHILQHIVQTANEKGLHRLSQILS